MDMSAVGVYRQSADWSISTKYARKNRTTDLVFLAMTTTGHEIIYTGYL